MGNCGERVEATKCRSELETEDRTGFNRGFSRVPEFVLLFASTQKSFLQPGYSGAGPSGLVFLKEVLDKQKPSMRLCAVEAPLSIGGGDNQDRA